MMEEASELLDRVQNGGVPADVHQLLPGLGAVRRDAAPGPHPAPVDLQEPPADGRGAHPRGLPAYAGVGDRRLVVVSLMPCTAKKAEAQELSGVDHVLTTRELGHLWRRFGIDFAPCAERGAARRAVRAGERRRPAVRRQRRRDGGGGPHRLPDGRRRRAGAGGRGWSRRAAGRRTSLHHHCRHGRARARRGQRPRAGRGRPSTAARPPAGAALRRGHELPRAAASAAAGSRTAPTTMSCAAGSTDCTRRTGARHQAGAREQQVRTMYDDLLGSPLGEVSHRLLHRTYTDRSGAAAQGATG